ncbi:MAG: glycosyltransferase [Lachnospiraceae bacterium]|nr:glycosyltransferase [Lachnospiraceae bacterium]MDE6979996.1 glycosyltransferase [Lachnospiraceae bacterium]
MKKMKVLQVNKLYYPFTGGIERVAQQIAEGLQDKTTMKVLVCNEQKKSISETINGVKVHRSGSLGMLGNMPVSLKFVFDLKRMAKNADIIQFHMPFPIGDLAGILSGCKGKIVVWWHSDVVRQKKLMMLYKPVMKIFLNRADAIIVATQGHIDGSQYLKPYAHKCVVIPYGVNPAIEKKADEWFEKTKNKPENKKDVPVTFLFVGRFVYYKGCKILLEAFRKVKNARLIMIGSGIMEKELKELAVSYGIEDRVIFTGNVSDDELEEYFANCDVFVLPSIVRSEAFGLVQIEAMAYGKPVINTNLPSGVPYVSIHNETGLTVEPEDAGGLATAMQWMVDHPKERIEMGKRARLRVKEKYQICGMLKNVLDLYKRLKDW